MSNEAGMGSPTESEVAMGNWHGYGNGKRDRAGRPIDRVYAVDDDYIIYFSDCDLFYDTTRRLSLALGVKVLGSTDAALARINRLLPDTPANKKGFDYRNKEAALELAADACEMVFCGETDDAIVILEGLEEKLQTTAEGVRRLCYQLGTITVTAVVWFLFIVWVRPENWEPWFLSVALALTGGVFSVFLKLGSLKVSVNQRLLFLYCAGATRSAIALLSGVAMLLAMRSGIFGGIGYKGVPPTPDAPLQITEMFFCFLAGFSEYLVPSILHESEKNSPEPKPAEAKPDNPPKPGATL